MIDLTPLSDLPVAQAIFPILGLAIAAIATGAQIAGGIIQNKQARRAENARRGAQELEAQRARLQAVREARIRRAEVAAAAESQGVSGSSGAVGAQASIGTQLQANIGFVNAQSAANATISNAQLKSNRAGLIASIGGEFANFGTSFAAFRNRQAQAAALREKNSANLVPFPGSN